MNSFINLNLAKIDQDVFKDTIFFSIVEIWNTAHHWQPIKLGPTLVTENVVHL